MKNDGVKGNKTVIVIGLDAADADLIEKWSRQGHLKAIASLLDRGSWI